MPIFKAFFMSKSSDSRMTPHINRRPREYLTFTEVGRVQKAAGSIGRFRLRDSTMILVMYRHGLRVSECVNMTWEQVNLEEGLLHIVRAKNGIDSTHPLSPEEVKALKRLQAVCQRSEYIFQNQWQRKLSTDTVRDIVRRAGDIAGISFKIHPHMLRHSCGYYLINKGVGLRTIQIYLGHRNIQSTVRYTALAANSFKGLW